MGGFFKTQHKKGYNMIVNIKKAVLHILDANSGISVFSKEELDLENKNTIAYICEHIDKVCNNPSMRTGIFKENSGFLYQLKQYKNNQIDFLSLSQNIAEKFYDLIRESDNITSSDLIISDCMMGEKPTIAIMKCDNKIGFVHQIMKNSESVKNEIVNHYAIMPPLSQRFSDYAFISLDDFSIKYKPKNIMVEGEKIDMFADGILECDFDFSTKESFNKMRKLAKKVTEDFAGNEIDTEAKIKMYVKDTAIVNENIKVEEVAEAVFNNSPSAREEFVEKVREAEIPETFKMNEYVTKRVNKNLKIVTDTGIEISFPPEYYKDEENIFIINNDDGTISIQINNVGQIINK